LVSAKEAKEADTMAFLDKLGDLARNIGDKTSETIETTKINNRIGSERTAIAECMRRIGEIYYRKHQEGDSGDPAAAELLATIDGHNRAIADAQTEIERIKAKAAAPTPAAAPAPSAAGAACPSCGAANPAGTKFCQECGAKTDAPTPAETTCPICGAPVPAANKFCGGCGHRLGANSGSR
jgi:predicted nucleic acid-binding Zn ribbon protein